MSININERVTLFNSLPPFSSLAIESVKKIINESKIKTYTCNNQVWNENSNELILILDGELMITRTQNSRLLRLGVGECIDTSLIKRFGVVCSDKCTIAELPKQLIMNLLEKKPAALEEYNQIQQQRLDILENNQSKVDSMRAFLDSQKLQHQYELERRQRSISQDKFLEYDQIKNGYRGTKIISERKRIDNVVNKRQGKGSSLIPGPLADFRLPSNYTSVYQMPRNLRQRLVDYSKLCKLTESQENIISTDQNYERNKKSKAEKNLRVSMDKIRGKVHKTDFECVTPKCEIIKEKHKTVPPLILPHLNLKQSRLEEQINTALVTLNQHQSTAFTSSQLSFGTPSGIKSSMRCNSISPERKFTFSEKIIKLETQTSQKQILSQFNSPKHSNPDSTLNQNEFEELLARSRVVSQYHELSQQKIIKQIKSPVVLTGRKIKMSLK